MPAQVGALIALGSAEDHDHPRVIVNGVEQPQVPGAVAFVRVITHPRIAVRPLTPGAAWSYVEDWLRVTVVWVPLPTDRHAAVLGPLVGKYWTTGNLVPDAHLAALAIEHGAEVISTDTDFARFTGPPRASTGHRA